MKETGIIMSGNHPKLILDGLKTQTRRTYGLRKINDTPDGWFGIPENIKGALWRFHNKNGTPLIVKCPYGQVGDRLWVRETWRCGLGEMSHQVYTDYSIVPVYYKADDVLIRKCCQDSYLEKHNIPSNWQSGLFMPRWASRITLEITEIRVERQLDITLEDAIAEGFSDIREFNETFLRLNPHLRTENPWAWAISFRGLK